MKWAVRKKMLAGYGAILLLLLVVLEWAFVNLLRPGRASDAIIRSIGDGIVVVEWKLNVSKSLKTEVDIVEHAE